MCALGEGATSQGDWHEGLNWAGIQQAAVHLFGREQQLRLASVPMDIRCRWPTWPIAATPMECRGVAYDGNDFFECYQCHGEAVGECAARRGPTLLEARTTRLTAHSSDDDDRLGRDRGGSWGPRNLRPVAAAGWSPANDGRTQTEGRRRDRSRGDATRSTRRWTTPCASYPEPEAVEHVFAPVARRSL